MQARKLVFNVICCFTEHVDARLDLSETVGAGKSRERSVGKPISSCSQRTNTQHKLASSDDWLCCLHNVTSTATSSLALKKKYDLRNSNQYALSSSLKKAGPQLCSGIFSSLLYDSVLLHRQYRSTSYSTANIVQRPTPPPIPFRVLLHRQYRSASYSTANNVQHSTPPPIPFSVLLHRQYRSASYSTANTVQGPTPPPIPFTVLLHRQYRSGSYSTANTVQGPTPPPIPFSILLHRQYRSASYSTANTVQRPTPPPIPFSVLLHRQYRSASYSTANIVQRPTPPPIPFSVLLHRQYRSASYSTANTVQGPTPPPIPFSVLLHRQYRSGVICLGDRASSAGIKGRGKREISEETRRPAASYSAIPMCENPGVTRSGIEPGLSWWDASKLTAQLPLPRAQ
ncbi:hypothetical protein PR048_017638 [Dryococelus australis]|uniref:Uncharacterized protein n=1 Tax=Dryococelus australis TaxID=614101 RepID=A0ABQ9HA61_9NEOP|nr:hypothetical protein PR048_017638 [Dryococelus australis]